MRVRNIYSANKSILMRGNSEKDYEVFKVIAGKNMIERIGFAYDSWQPRHEKPWRFRKSVTLHQEFKAECLRELMALIEAEYGSGVEA